MVTLPDGMEYWASSNEFEAAEHGGTHIDAPYHFNKEGWKVDDIPFERFFGKGNCTRFHKRIYRMDVFV